MSQVSRFERGDWCARFWLGSGENCCVSMLTKTARTKATGRGGFTFRETVDAEFVQHAWDNGTTQQAHTSIDARIGDAGLKELISSNNLPAIE
jgi:hypothetical protein